MWETQPNVTYMLKALNGSKEVSPKHCTNVTADITMKCTLNDLAKDTLYVVRVNASFEVYSAVEQVYVHTKEMKEVQQNNKGAYHMQTNRKGTNKQTNKQTKTSKQTSKPKARQTDRQTKLQIDRHIHEYLIKGN